MLIPQAKKKKDTNAQREKIYMYLFYLTIKKHTNLNSKPYKSYNVGCGL